MTRSSNNDLSLILDWIANAKSYDAWEDLNALVDQDPEEAWSFVRDMVDVAPPALLGAIAAGPLEDLLHKYGNLLGDRILEAARTDAALHECLGGVYEPEPLATRIQEVLAQPPISGTNRRAESLTKERFARIARWFHQSDTMWASSHLGDMIHTDAQAAWRLLLDMVNIAKDEHPDVARDRSARVRRPRGSAR